MRGTVCRQFVQAYNAVLYPNISGRVELIRHKLAAHLAGDWFSPHVHRAKDYAFSDSLDGRFGDLREISARLGVQCGLVALLHWRVTAADDGEFTGKKLIRQQHVFLKTEAVYLYEPDFNPSIERELIRQWKAVLHATWDWKQDSLRSRYIAAITDELYRGDGARAGPAADELTRLDGYLATLPWKDVVENRIDWQGTSPNLPLHT